MMSLHMVPSISMFSAALSSLYCCKPTAPVWFGSRLFVHSERTATRITC